MAKNLGLKNVNLGLAMKVAAIRSRPLNMTKIYHPYPIFSGSTSY
jgi:hypothetical protein